MSIEEKVRETILKHSMFLPGEKVLAAVSGGPDSVALLHLLLELSSKLRLDITAFHLDHRLREESEEDSRFVVALCDRLGVPLKSASFDVPGYLRETGLSVEDGARRVRYRLLKEAADEIAADRIALGHQADDQVETFFMRLIRGAGLTGLAAIPPVRGRFVRPLIEVGKEEILQYLNEIGESFVIDASNEDLSFLRNRVRRRLIPEMLEENPALKEVVEQTIEIIREDEAQLDIEATRFFDDLACADEGIVVMPAGAVASVPRAVARRLVRLGIERIKGNLLGIEFRHIRLVLDGLAEGSLRMDLPGDLIAAIEGDDFIIGEQVVVEPPVPAGIAIRIPGVTRLNTRIVVEAEVRSADGFAITKDASVAQLDADLVGSSLTARGWESGDSFRPLGMAGEKKLSDFFVDEKVPRRLRLRTPIIEGEKGIVWVTGMRIDNRFKVTAATRKVLVLTVRELEEADESRTDGRPDGGGDGL